MDERIERARTSYEAAVFDGDRTGLASAEEELDAVEADVALARGRLLHARFLDGRVRVDARELPLFERAVELYRAAGDPRGEAEALFWVGCFHQVVGSDDAAAAAPLRLAGEMATAAGDKLTASYALRHLGLTEHGAGRWDAARELIEESTRLRREVGFLPGVAANLVGLAYIAAALGDRDEAVRILGEAAGIADEWGAYAVTDHIEQARLSITATPPGQPAALTPHPPSTRRPERSHQGQAGLTPRC